LSKLFAINMQAFLAEDNSHTPDSATLHRVTSGSALLSPQPSEAITAPPPTSAAGAANTVELADLRKERKRVVVEADDDKTFVWSAKLMESVVDNMSDLVTGLVGSDQMDADNNTDLVFFILSLFTKVLAEVDTRHPATGAHMRRISAQLRDRSVQHTRALLCTIVLFMFHCPHDTLRCNYPKK